MKLCVLLCTLALAWAGHMQSKRLLDVVSNKNLCSGPIEILSGMKHLSGMGTVMGKFFVFGDSMFLAPV